jgi:HAD superfamily hydrolase (TIGR01457 family)
MIPAYTTYLIDLDGVVYRGETLVKGAKEFVTWLDRTQKKYLFLTNNSFASEQQTLEKLARLGIQSDSSHVLGAGQATVQNIAHHYPGATVYVIGEQPLINMVQAHDLKVAPVEQEQADVVLVGLDRTFTYQKLTSSVKAVLAGAKFIAINRDAMLPIAGDLIPGCGTMVAAIEAGSGVHPEVIGKPQPGLLQEAMLRLESTADETVMIGDVLMSDIKAGLAAGTHTILVLSGKDTRQSLERSEIQPEHVFADLSEVLTQLQ